MLPTCVPTPKCSRPSASCCTPQAPYASNIGLRGNARMMLVTIFSRSLCSATSAAVIIPSLTVSGT